ncbi:MAG: galactokinase [Chitinophagaceae bacterium]|nr:galactokinase [Chitinophagaceae bacterium]
MEKGIRILFNQQFGSEPVVSRSPGRINVIGEHTDYNHGFVLPAAIDKYIYVAAAANGTNMIRLYAAAFNERIELEVEALRKYPGSWINYILGVVAELQKANYKICGFDLVVDGDLPIGAGLSSSAAMECATCEALNAIFGLGVKQEAIIQYAQWAEHNYAGVQCGIMDQFASVRGEKNHAILLDCQTLDYQYIPLDLKDYQLVLFNSNVKHSLASSQYNIRRQECEEVVAIIQRHLPRVKSIRDITVNMLVGLVHDPVLFKRAKYVIEENDRVQKAVKYLLEQNIVGVGQQLFKSHAGLSEDYEVSCKELDWLVNAVSYRYDVAGARMMGGGFGGCTINIVRTDKVAELTSAIAEEYEKAMQRSLSAYVVNSSGGTEVLTKSFAI